MSPAFGQSACIALTVLTLTTATDGANSAGFSYLRIPLGASDFSANGERTSCAWVTDRSHRRHAVYSFDDVSGDNALSSFNINKAPSYLFSVLNDIRSINSQLRIHILPWSPVCRRCYPEAAYRMAHMCSQPGWMKDSRTMNGGNFLSNYTSVCESSDAPR